MLNPSCWPTPDERRLLRAALLERAAARASFDEWSRHVELDDVDPASQALLPLVAHNLRGESLVPTIAGRLRGLRRRTWVDNQRRARRLAGVLSALDRERVPAMIFKGLPLALQYYPGTSTRAMSDVDLWVPPSGVAAARAILGAAGFAPRPGLLAWPPAGQPAWAYGHPGGDCIDLHAHVLADALYDAADDAFLRHAVRTSVGGFPVLVPGSADHLAIVLGHGLRWNPVPPVRWAADAVMLIRARPALDWKRLVEVSRFLRLSAVVGAGLAWLAGNLEVEVPREVLRDLGRATTLAERIEMGVRQAPPTGVLGALPQMLAVYTREALGHGRRPTPWGFASSLGRAWGVSGTRDLAAVAARKARRRIAAVVGLAP